MTMSLGLHLGLGHHRGSSIGGSPANAVNTVAPSISGTRGGTLTATPGTWTGATSVSGQWYADGAATGNTTTSFTDSDTSKSLEYRETALPGNVVASGYLGASASANPTGTATTWNPADKAGTVTLSPDNLTATSTNGNVRGTTSKSSGKFYAEVLVGGTPNNNGFGVMTASGSITALMTDTATTLALYNSGYTNRGTGTGFSSGAVVGMAIDRDAGLAWFAVNGTWQFGDPAAGTGGKALPTGALFLATGGPGDVMTLRTSAATQTYAPPTGFLVWDAATTQVTASISNQPSTIPGNKQVDVVFNIDIVGTTGAQYKVETEAGQFVQGWTSLTYDSVAKKATGSYPIPPFAYEGQKLRAICRNVGGTVQTIFALTGTNGYVMSTPMRVGINDLGWFYWSFHTPGRDWAERCPNTVSMGIADKNFATSFRQPFKAPGLTRDNYNHWAEAYNPAQLYPSTTGTTVYGFCTYQGLSWQTTDTTAKTRAAPDTSNLSGVGGDWKLASGPLADASLVNLTADGLPTKLPDDPNLTIFFTPPWYPTASHGAAGFTVTYKTQPGIAFRHAGSLGNTTFSQSPADIAAGQFTLTYKPTTFGNYNPQLWIDRANSTATLDSTFFLAGIPSFATGTPSADIGSPYMDTDKQADIAPFAGVRFMGALPIQRTSGSWNGTFTAANNVMPDGTLRIWKLIADQANLSGAQYVWLNEPDGADTSFRTAMATFFRDHLNAGIKIALERSNEQWNTNYQNAQDLLARANALVSTDGAYQKPYLLHCREHNAMVAVWKSVFGAAYASRVEPQLAWQSVTSTSTWQQMLDFENTWQNVGRISIAPYVDGGIGTYKSTATGDQASMNAAISAGDQTAFNTALTSYLAAQTDNEVALCKALFNFLPGYSMSKGLDKNAIQVSYYEAGFFQVSYSSFAALGAGKDTVANTFFTAYKRANTGLGARFAYYIDQIRLNGPGLMMTFQLLGPTGLQFGASTDTWGMMDGTGQTTQEPMATVRAKALAYN
jgi:hypothetical protein